MASVFGPTIVVDGDLGGDGDVVVHGAVRGKISGVAALTIAKGARVEAAITGASAHVAGHVEGAITARDRIELTAESVMNGDVRAPRILIADGARFRGNVDMDAPRAPSEEAP